MVEVFKTNITEAQQAAALLAKLHQYLPHCQVNFDLQDCDNILRIKGNHIPVAHIIQLVNNNGFECNLLD